MSILLNVLIDDIELSKSKETWDSYWMEAIQEAENEENAQITFESIVGGDNAVKKGLSGIVRWISSLGYNNKKLAFDMEIFEKIDKSKISKDVTGVATPEYVKVVADLLASEPSFTRSDLNRMARLTEKVSFKKTDAGNIAKFLSSLTAGISWYYVFKAFTVTPGYGIFAIGFDILSLILSIYSISETKYTTSNMKDSEVNELLDLTCKMYNSFININSSTIDNNSLTKADELINLLSSKEKTTITVADQNQVADMLLEVSKAKDQVKNSIPTINKQGALGSIYSIGSEFKRGFKGIDPEIYNKCNDIIKLTTKVNVYMDALAGASKTIASDIRKW